MFCLLVWIEIVSKRNMFIDFYCPLEVHNICDFEGHEKVTTFIFVTRQMTMMKTKKSMPKRCSCLDRNSTQNCKLIFLKVQNNLLFVITVSLFFNFD